MKKSKICSTLFFVFIFLYYFIIKIYAYDDIESNPPNRQLTYHKVVHHKARDSSVKSLSIGFMAGAIEAFIAHPLWVWKIRAQYGGTFTIKPRILYKGVLPSMGTTATIISTRVSIQDFIIRDLFNTNQPGNFLRFGSAFTGGIGSTLLSCPLELCLTQQQVMTNKLDFFSTGKIISKLRGSHNLFRGATLVAARDGLVCSGYLALTPILTLMLYDEYTKPPSYLALCSGLFCSFISHPLDSIKTIKHSAPIEAEVRSNFTIAHMLWNDKGIKGFYKGFGWRALRVSLATLVLSRVVNELTSFSEIEYD